MLYPCSLSELCNTILGLSRITGFPVILLDDLLYRDSPDPSPSFIVGGSRSRLLML